MHTFLYVKKIKNTFMQISVGQSRVKLGRMMHMGELGCHGFAASIQIVQ